MGADATAAQRCTAQRICICPAWDAAQEDASEQLFGRNFKIICPALSFASSCISSSLTWFSYVYLNISVSSFHQFECIFLC